MTVDHQLTLQEMVRVQKTVLNHEQVIHQLMTYLLSMDARQRRDSKASTTFTAPGENGTAMSAGASQVTGMEDEPSSPLQQASKLLSDMNSEVQFNMAGMDGMGEPPKTGPPVVSTPTPMEAGRNGAVRTPASAAPNQPIPYQKANNEIDPMVYPVGATNGIDPMYSEHINNVPYPMPTKTEVDSGDARRQFPDNRKKSKNVDPGWVRSPHILLVEDDATCRQIGGKFLYSFSCVIDTAVCLTHLSFVMEMDADNLVRWTRGCEQDSGRLEVRSYSDGYHHAESGWCFCLPFDPPV